MSQRATISPCAPASFVSLSPLPPTPMQANRTFSFGLRRGGWDRAAAQEQRASAGDRGCAEKLTTIHGGDSEGEEGGFRGAGVLGAGCGASFGGNVRRPGGALVSMPRRLCSACRSAAGVRNRVAANRSICRRLVLRRSFPTDGDWSRAAIPSNRAPRVDADSSGASITTFPLGPRRTLSWEKNSSDLAGGRHGGDGRTGRIGVLGNGHDGKLQTATVDAADGGLSISGGGVDRATRRLPRSARRTDQRRSRRDRRRSNQGLRRRPMSVAATGSIASGS